MVEDIDRLTRGIKMAKGAPDSVALLLFFVFWYAGNMKYNEYNTGALNAVGGKTAGMTMTVSTFQLIVCAAHAFVVWIVGYNPIKLCGLQAPEKQSVPKLTMGDVKATIPVGVCSAGAHSSSSALGGDPPFSARSSGAGRARRLGVVNTVFYGKARRSPEGACLPVGRRRRAPQPRPSSTRVRWRVRGSLCGRAALLFGMQRQRVRTRS